MSVWLAGCYLCVLGHSTLGLAGWCHLYVEATLLSVWLACWVLSLCLRPLCSRSEWLAVICMFDVLQSVICSFA